jgi:hypothetical protein
LHSFRGTPLIRFDGLFNYELSPAYIHLVSRFAVKSAVKRMLGKYLQPDFVKRIQHEVDMYNHLGRWAQLPKLDLFPAALSGIKQLLLEGTLESVPQKFVRCLGSSFCFLCVHRCLY